MNEIVIVGAGPAGLAATVAAVDAGCKVTLIDEHPRPGGQIYKQAPEGMPVASVGNERELERKRKLFAEYERVRSRVDYRPKSTAHSLYTGPELQVADDNQSERLWPNAVILATGVSERCVPFPGWTLPGVLYAGGAQSLLKSQGVAPGQRVVVAGTGVLPIAVSAQLTNAGVTVRAVVLLNRLNSMIAGPIGMLAGWRVIREGFEYLRTLKQAGVPVLEGWAPVRINGEERANEIVIAPVDSVGNHDLSRSRNFEVDAVGVNFGFAANSELARMAGVACAYDPVLGGWLPNCDRFGRTDSKGIYVAGDGAGLRGAFVAEAEGTIVGACAASDILGRDMPNVPRAVAKRSKHERFQVAVRKTLALPKGVWSWAEPGTVVCRCEGVTVQHLRDAVSEDHCSLNAIKRNTRAGMGWCGGRTCLQAVAAFAANGDIDANVEPMRARPVARPVKLGALANVRSK